MANKWLDALKAKNTPRNTEEGCAREESSPYGDWPTPKNPLDKVGKNGNGTPISSKNGRTPEKALDKIDKNTRKAKKKLTPEEEEREISRLAEAHPSYVVTESRAREVLEWARGISEVSLDIETYGRIKSDALLYTRGRVRMILLYHGGQSWFIDCDHTPEATIVEILTALKGKTKYLHNALFDIPRLYRRFGVLLDEGVEDTMIMSQVAHAGEWQRKKGLVVQITHKLEECLKRELDLEIPKNRDLKWAGLLTNDHLGYAGDDIANLEGLHAALSRVLEKHKVKGRYEAIRDRLPDFIGAAVRGVPIEVGRLQPILDAYAEEIRDLEARLGELAPEHPEGAVWMWNNTSKEITPECKGRNGALRALSLLGVEIKDMQGQTLLDHREDHEIVGILYNYRTRSNTLSRYRRWIPDFYDPETGRMYPQPKVAKAVTGRVLYSDPNAQGIDKHKTKEFRVVVRAPEGRAIVKGDFAQQELRIAAYFSEDRAMLGAFRDGRDIYQETAKKLVGHEVSKDDPARSAAKRATLGFLYGLGVDKYRTNVYKDTREKISGEQAIKDRQAFRAAFPTFYNWQKRYGARYEWGTRSVLGWRRVVAPGWNYDGEMTPKYTERLNGPIQSTAGDILYLALEKMSRDPRPGTHFLLSVHDELVLECPADEARDVAVWLKDKMRAAIEEVLGAALGGPKSVEVGYGPSWGECTEEV